jgi:hypothetical protein
MVRKGRKEFTLACGFRALARSFRALARSFRALARSFRALARSFRALARSFRALARSFRALARNLRARVWNLHSRGFFLQTRKFSPHAQISPFCAIRIKKFPLLVLKKIPHYYVKSLTIFHSIVSILARFLVLVCCIFLRSVPKPVSFECNILKLVWAMGFAPEQPLHVVAIACPASKILKQLGHI